MASNNKSSIGYVYSFIACVLFGSIYIGSNIALREFSPVQVCCLRFLFGSAGLLVLNLITKKSLKIEKSDFKYFIMVAFIGYFLSYIFAMYSNSYAGPVLASLLNSLNPVFIAIFGVIMLHEKITVKHWILLGVALVGVYIICSGNVEGEIIGVICATLSMVAWGFSSSHNKRLCAKYDPLVVAFWAIVLSLIFYIPTITVDFAMNGIPHASIEAWLAVAYVGIFGITAAQSIWLLAMSKLPMSTCSMFYPIQPLTSAIIGVLFLDSKLTARLLIGGVLICAAIMLNFIDFGKMKERLKS